jgi:hypothetical protein
VKRDGMRTTEKTNKKERKKKKRMRDIFEQGHHTERRERKKYIDIYTTAGSSSVGWPPSKVPS